MSDRPKLAGWNVCGPRLLYSDGGEAAYLTGMSNGRVGWVAWHPYPQGMIDSGSCDDWGAAKAAAECVLLAHGYEFQEERKHD